MMKSTEDKLIDLIREIIPNLGTTWVDNYEAKDVWRKRAEKLLAEIDNQREPTVIVWSASPKRCTCEKFGGGMWDFECPVCGGGRF